MPVVVLDDRQVLADLADASEREDAQLAAHAAWTPRQQTVPLEGAADDRELGLVGLDERQPQAADVVAEQVQRGLDRDRARGAEHRLEDVAQRGVDLRAALRLVEHAAHLGADDVAGDADAAGAAEVEAAGEVLVVAGQQRHAVDRAELGASWTA